MTHPFTQSAAEEFRKMMPSGAVSLIGGSIMTADQFREKIIRGCIEALAEPTYVVGDIRDQYERDKAALESLLPKPDRAKELVEEYRAVRGANSPFEEYADELDFARWLLTKKGAKL